MSNIRGRLRRLESKATDSTGFVVNSPAWIDYWVARAMQIVNGVEVEGGEGLPLEFIAYILEETKDYKFELETED